MAKLSDESADNDGDKEDDKESSAVVFGICYVKLFQLLPPDVIPGQTDTFLLGTPWAWFAYIALLMLSTHPYTWFGFEHKWRLWCDVFIIAPWMVDANQKVQVFDI